MTKLSMSEEEIQKNSEHWYNKYKDAEKQTELLGERCNQLLKDKGDLTDRIDDIKANCDLAIEGRDIKITELEQGNNKLLDVINNQDVKIADLEKQIEKMKCCENCKHKKSEVDRCELLMYTMNACLCKNKDKWQLRR